MLLIHRGVFRKRPERPFRIPSLRCKLTQVTRVGGVTFEDVNVPEQRDWMPMMNPVVLAPNKLRHSLAWLSREDHVFRHSDNSQVFQEPPVVSLFFSGVQVVVFRKN